jgi:hypothetical protein
MIIIIFSLLTLILFKVVYAVHVDNVANVSGVHVASIFRALHDMRVAVYNSIKPFIQEIE